MDKWLISFNKRMTNSYNCTIILYELSLRLFVNDLDDKKH